MKRAFASALILVSIAAMTGCGSMPPLDDSLENDITSSGFLDDHRFQKLITAYPEPWARGVNQRRDSSRNRAYAALQQEVIIALYQQAPAVAEKGSDHAISSGNYARLLDLYSLGSVKTVYYGPGDETIIVYRIARYKLKSRLEDIDPDAL